MTGRLLSQGAKAPNYVYEPMAYFEDVLKALYKTIDFGPATEYMGTLLKEELPRVLSSGKPREGSFLEWRSTTGHDITDGGDVIAKTIRLRYSHLRGWVEEQDSFKVSPKLVLDLSGPIFSLLKGDSSGS